MTEIIAIGGMVLFFVTTVSAILFWLIVFWIIVKAYKESRRRESVIEDIEYCPCRLSSVGACGVTETYGDIEECGVEAHLTNCKSEGCNGLGDLVDKG